MGELLSSFSFTTHNLITMWNLHYSFLAEHNEVMDLWNRIIVLDKYSVLNETNTKFSLKRDPVLPFPSSKPLQHSHIRVLLDKHCRAGFTDNISAYSDTHFGRSLQLKRAQI